jgi:hypothetical protein
MMRITLVTTGEKKEVIISAVKDDDFRVLTKKRYFFSWKTLKGKASLYKLSISGEEDILGVMALVDEPGDKRIEIKLLVSSKENVGKKKIYDGIAGCLIAYACREAVKKYADLACLSLVPKTELRSNYIIKYGMMDAGWQLFLEAKPLTDLILKYLS